MNNGNAANGNVRWGYWSFTTGFRPRPVPILRQEARRYPMAAINNRLNRAVRSRQQGDVEEAEALEAEAERIFCLATSN